MNKLFVDAAVQQRIMTAMVVGNSYHRVMSSKITRLSTWKAAIRSSYSPRSPRPQLPLLDLQNAAPNERSKEPGSGEKAPNSSAGTMPRINDHRDLNVRSVIDINAWDRAKWQGTAYLEYTNGPPAIALTFEDREGVTKIFERWRERFGKADKDEEIHVAIVRHLPSENRHHCIVVVTSKLPETTNVKPTQAFVMASRSMTMEPENDVNLSRFIQSHRKWGAFFIMPAVSHGSVMPDVLNDLSILKRNLTIKDASEVKENDLEATSLRMRKFPVGRVS